MELIIVLYLMTILSHPAQQGFEGLSDLLSLCVASLCDNINDGIFICSCGE